MSLTKQKKTQQTKPVMYACHCPFSFVLSKLIAAQNNTMGKTSAFKRFFPAVKRKKISYLWKIKSHRVHEITITLQKKLPGNSMTLIIHICCSLAILLGLITLKKTYRLWPMHIFLIASEITNIFFLLSHSDILVGNIYIVFVIVEAGAFTFIFKDIVKLKQFLFMILCLFVLFFTVVTNGHPGPYLYSFLRISPPLIIVIGCSFYFYNLLEDPYSEGVLKSSYFWIVIGALLHFITNIPALFLAENIEELYPRLLSISLTVVRFFYIVLYLCIIKAFLCRNSN